MELEEELRSHIDLRTDEKIKAGMNPEEARFAALREFGWTETIKEDCRNQRGVRWLENLGLDIRFGVRQLQKNPGFTAVAVLTLAIGIGANTAIFSVLDRLLVRPLQGVRDPQQLGLLVQGSSDGHYDQYFNYPLFRDYQKGNSVFSHLTATANIAVGVAAGGAPERQEALLVSGNYFAMLGVTPAIGRTFTPDEGVEIDDAAVLVISHGFWLRRFGADPKTVGRTISINSHPFTIIGVAPREFTGTTRGEVPDLYVPFPMYGQLTDDRPGGDHPLRTRYFTWHQILGRLKDGVSHAQAQTAMNLLAQQVYAVTPANTSTNLAVLPGGQGFTSGVSETTLPLHLLMATAGLVLLIVCANLANLQLAKASGRAREFAVRMAMGARRGQLIRQLLTESMLLSLLGGALGLLIAVWLTGILEHFRMAKGAFQMAGGIDLRVLGFASLASILSGVVFGLAPAVRASNLQLVPELKGAKETEARARRWNLRGSLVVAQVSISLLVLVSAGLCVRSLRKLQGIDPGFEPSRILLVSIDLGMNKYGEAQAKDFWQQLQTRVSALPGVESVGLAAVTPLGGSHPGMSINRIEGYETKDKETLWADFNLVSEDYFKTLNVPIIRGRTFDATDTASSLKTVVVDQAFAQQYWPDQNPIGRRLLMPPDSKPVEVVGVVGSVRNRSLTEKPHRTMFFPLSQGKDGSLNLAVRTGLEPSTAIPMLRNAVKAIDPSVPLFQIRTMEQQLRGSFALQRMAATLLAGFGVLALFLTALGIYGVLAYSVGQRTREIGVRMALGAQITDVLRLVMRQGLILVGIGLALGLVSAWGATRLLRGFLFGVQPLDPGTFSTVLLMLIIVAFTACWLPARRAASVDPMKALRTE